MFRRLVVGALTIAMALMAHAIVGCNSNSNSNTPPAAPKPANPPPKIDNPSTTGPLTKIENPPATLQPGHNEARPEADGRQYQGPPAHVQITMAKRLPPISEATVGVDIPSGGWNLALDKGEVANGTAKIYLTLEKPGENEIVTQIAGTLQESFTSEMKTFTKAQVYIHLAQRGVSTLTTDYRLAVTGDMYSTPDATPFQPPLADTIKPNADRIVINEDAKYDGPPVRARRLKMESEPPQQVVLIEITNKTGGWTLKLDKGEVIEDGKARVFLTLQKPADDEIVTQAITTVTQSFMTDRPVKQALVYINLTQRGVSASSTDYRLATTE